MVLMHCDHARGGVPEARCAACAERKAVSHHERRNCRPKHPSRIVRIKLDLQSALPAVDEDAGFAERRLLDRNRHAFSARTG
jgi:hypothetical protein